MCRYFQIIAVLLLGLWGVDAAQAVSNESSPIRLDVLETVPQVNRGPYLQTLTEDSVIVRWRTDLATDSVVRYGTDSASLTSSASEAGSTTEHSVTLTGLADQTQYFYSIGDSSNTFAGDASYRFQTAPVPGTATATRFWVLGDSGTANSNARAVRDAYKAWAASGPSDFMVMLGDNAYNDGTQAQYQAAVFDTYPELLRQLPLWSTLGNHDGHSADSASQTGPYYEIFDFPISGEAGGLASGTEAYYSFDYGNIHFIVLDSYETDRSPGGTMLTWLESDLATNVQPWIIALWHHPAYTKGSHNSDSEGQLIDMRQNALPLLEAWGVDLVLSGHSHSYERSMLIDGHYGSSTSLDIPTMILDIGDGSESSDGAYQKPGIIAAMNEGAVYAVAGSSGKISGVQSDWPHPVMVSYMVELGSMVVDVNGSRLDATFIDDGGTVRDQFTLLKTPDSEPPLLSAVRAEDASHVLVDFSEYIDPATGGEALNFAIAGLGITSAVVQPGNRTVRLTTSVMTSGTSYVLTVNNIRDVIGNTIAPDSQSGFQFNQTMTISFQDGLAPAPAYDGTFDTYIREASPTTNYGSASTLQADGDEPSGSGTDMAILLGWDISDIPADAIVDSASIHLNTRNVGGPYSCFALLRSWQQAEVNWNQADNANNWGAAGAEAASDRGNLELCTVSAGSTGPLTVNLNGDGLDLVQGWIEGSTPNFGLVIHDPASSNGADFDSSESATAMNRPRLEVTYHVPVVANVPPTAGFSQICTDLDCDFNDTSSDSDGSVVGWSWDFGDGNVSSQQNPSHSYATAGTRTVELTVTDDDGDSDTISRPVTVTGSVGFSDHQAQADLPGAGTVSDTFTATHVDDGTSQSIRERESGGKKDRRHSYLVHTWQFSLPASAQATLHADAWHDGSSDDDFVISFSTDNSNYSNLFMINSSSDDSQSMVLPGSPSGTVYVRVTDTDQSQGNRSLDTVFIDHLFIRTENGGGDPPAAPSGLETTADGHDRVDLTWVDESADESGFNIERSTDGVTFSAVTSVSANQNSYTDSGLAGGITYTFRVNAFNASGPSGWSNTASATTGAGPDINLELSGRKRKGNHIIDLTWSGTTESDVDIYRDSDLPITVADSGFYPDETSNKGGRTYTYKVCEAGTTKCSAVESITF